MAQNIKALSSFSAKKAIVGLKELSNPLLISLNSTELKEKYNLHGHCIQAQRLNWLFSKLGGEGAGMMDVLYCVLNDSPEALNMMHEEHIRVIISLLEKFGRDQKVKLVQSFFIYHGKLVV